MFRASLRFRPPVSSHLSEGRTISAPTATSSELVSSSNRDAEYLPWRASHCAGPAAHPAPVTSTPLPSQRSCHV